MKTFYLITLFALLLSTQAPAAALANEPCYKEGDKVSVYGAIDVVHFFHGGNGMHVQGLTVHVDRKFCVAPGWAEGTEFHKFQLLSDDSNRPLPLKDGQLVKLEGVYNGFGDTAWYTSFPLLKNVKIVKVFKTDPNEVK